MNYPPFWFVVLAYCFVFGVPLSLVLMAPNWTRSRWMQLVRGVNWLMIHIRQPIVDRVVRAFSKEG